ncbi:hypothetical protein GCM10023189_49480 [Nibrella saemangeumensis]|uniref:Uncharacterized protein n=1 Tax=Nibrella saemangeumensis TaxID=1084526 RepID=A0ABP8NJC4_9BACT
MFPLIPSKSFTIDSPLTREDALRRIRASVLRSGELMAGHNQEPEHFQGIVWEYEFQISRVSRYRSVFMPSITGQLYTHQNRLQIQVTMSLSPVALVLTILGLILVGIFALTSLFQLMATGHINSASLLPLELVSLVYLLIAIGFGIEAGIATRYLRQLLDAAEPATTHQSTLSYLF